jgi:hypothetical protein
MRPAQRCVASSFSPLIGETGRSIGTTLDRSRRFGEPSFQAAPRREAGPSTCGHISLSGTRGRPGGGAARRFLLAFSAPSTGESFSYKFGPAFFEYPDGVYIGAPSIVTLAGIDQHVLGFLAEAGRTVVVGEVIAVTPEGVPIVDFVGPTLSEHGNQLDPAASLANICAALAG